jgi:hypothetical protein
LYQIIVLVPKHCATEASLRRWLKPSDGHKLAICPIKRVWAKKNARQEEPEMLPWR